MDYPKFDKLIFIDVSGVRYYNQLTGEIPQQVCNLIESNNLYFPFIVDGNNLINTFED